MATRMFDRGSAAATTDPHERVAAIVARHGDLLLRVARQYAFCADDAHDAVQRALEIYMRRLDSLDPATELAWMKVVVKHESLAVRRSRAALTSEDVDLDAVPAATQRSVEERFESSERVERSAEVMRRLKRDEARALMLKAEGLSYNEIGERLGWTYTKVNRCITEGRRHFMRLYEELETGIECERLAPSLQALAKGNASSESLLELRPHLRNCASCRATIRALHSSHLGRLSAFAAALIAPARAIVERMKGAGARAPSEGPGELHPLDRQEEVEELFRRLNGGEAALQPAAPSVAEGVGRFSTVRVNIPNWAETVLHRLQSSDLAMGIHAASTSGGGRITSIAALIGICVSGVGAGTYCVTTALLPDPKPMIRSEPKSAERKATEKKLVRLPAPASRAAGSTSTPTPTPTPKPPPARKTHHTSRSASHSTSKSHEQAPISPAQAGTQDFSFEQAADPAPVAPAAAPSTGGGEFEP